MKNIVKNSLDKICKIKITLSIEPKFQKYEIFFGTLIENKALLKIVLIKFVKSKLL